MSTLAACAVSPSFVARMRDVARQVGDAALGEFQDAGFAEEVEGRQPAREPGRAAGREHMRRAGGVIAERDRRVVAQEDGAGVVDPLGQLLGRIRGDVQMLRADLAGPATRLGRRLGEHESAELFEAVPGQVAARQFGELAIEGLLDGVEQRFVPGDEDAARGIVLTPGRSGRRRRIRDWADSSARTTTSLGPARQSIATVPQTYFLASVTKRLPGPTIMSTGGTSPAP